ncbi:MAG TPA: DNA-binding protein WhiA [Synergistales bacterium]|nr:DNA-binding protein WhiA [Synergistales bacterium]
MGEEPLEKIGQLLCNKQNCFRRRTRYGFSETVIRDQSSIVGMLSNMQMFRTSLLLEEKAMLRSMKERANKVVNCDASNIRKSLETAKRQLETAEELIVTGKIRMLSEAFRELVYARMENPSATLRELGQVLSKPVSKSTVEYRWRKIEHLAGISSE